MKLVLFHPDAEGEMADAAAWYERQQKDLGKRFLASVQEAINRISVNPALYPFVDRDVRRCLAKTFPYGVVYQIREKDIVIFAVMHLHRRPDYWKQRSL